MTNYTDIAVDDNMNFIIVNGRHTTVTGNEETLQRCKIALKVFLGEWSQDPSKGLDFFNEIGGKPISSNNPRQEIMRVLLNIEGVQSITKVEEINYNSRGLKKLKIYLTFDDNETGVFEL